MEQEQLTAYSFSSAVSNSGMIIITHRGYTKDGLVRLTVGSPGLPNVKQDLDLGDAIVFQTANDGMYEVRLTGSGEEGQAYFLCSKIAPAFGLSAGFDAEDSSNSPLSVEEIERVRLSFADAKSEIQSHAEIAPEQFQILDRKLEEILLASSRMGRKDWLMYAAGALTSLCISAAFSPEASKAVFVQISESLSWLFSNALHLV